MTGNAYGTRSGTERVGVGFGDTWTPLDIGIISDAGHAVDLGFLYFLIVIFMKANDARWRMP